MHIIGGGIIGLCSAWYLRKAGFDVTVIDKTEMQDGCSFGNSGIIVPSHSIPLASPGVVAKGLQWMFKAKSPFYIKPRLDADLMRWLWRFYWSCSAKNVSRAMPVMIDFHILSKSLYKEFASRNDFDFSFEDRGSLMLYRTQHGEEEEKEAAEMANALGLRTSHLSLDEIRTMDPGMEYDVGGGIMYHDDAHLYPSMFMVNLRKALEQSGVVFETGKAVEDFHMYRDRITHLILSDGTSEKIKDVVLTAGAWSGKVAKQLGFRLLIQDGKGYSVTLKNPPMRPAFPSILTEARVAVTPMGNDLRIGGTMEINNFRQGINAPRVSAILDAMTRYYPSFPQLTPDTQPVWYGFRPVSADGVPYIGRSKKFSNLIIATGHAMLGMSLGPATGLLVSEIKQGKKTSIPMELFVPERHG